MKNTLLALSLALVSTAVLAQPVITSTSNPEAGDRFTLIYTNAPSVAGAAGTDKTWNYSTLSTTDADTLIVESCSGTPHCADFPGATMAGRYPSVPGDFDYYSASSTAFTYHGYYSGSSKTLTDPQDLMRYPFTYNSLYVDTFSCLFANAGYTYQRWGVISQEGKGYGTLILPYGTFTDVLLTRTYESWDDSTIENGIVYHYIQVGWTWYAPGRRMELLNTYNRSGAGMPPLIVTYYTVQSPTGLQELNTSNAVQLYPNPASEQCTIHAKAGFEAGAYVDILGVDGRLLATHQLQGKDFTIPVSELAPGLYTCRIYNGGVQVKKLLVAR